MFFKYLLLINLLFFSIHANAYLDPTSGGAIAYIVLSILSTGIYFFKNVAHQFFSFMASSLRFSKTKNNQNNIVFYSEGAQYWYVFEPILKSLSSMGRGCLYLTSDKNDPALSSNLALIDVEYVGKVNLAAGFLRHLKADFVGMTTPQLDVLNLKRSKSVKHYCHIVHAPVDVFTYRKFAFDYFDSVFCSGPHQIKSIRYLEEKRKTKAKNLYQVGCTYYDFLLEKVSKIETTPKKNKIILVAPTWKEYSLLHKHGVNFFDLLLNNTNYEVILRPHPQIYKSYPQVIGEIEKHFSKHPRFSIDRNPSGELSMQKCDLMISDLSGIIWDYVFLFSRPVLLVETPLNLDGFEGTEIPHVMWELESIPKIGRRIKDHEISNIHQIIDEFLENKNSLELTDFKQNSIYNWGHCGEAAAKQIIQIVDGLTFSGSNL